LLPVGRVVDLENCYVKRRGPADGTCEAIKRFGTLALPTVGTTMGPLGTHQNALVETGVPFRTLAAPTGAAWTVAGGDLRGGISLTSLKVAGNAAAPDIAYGNGYYWVIARDVRVDSAGVVQAATILNVYALDVATGHIAFSSTMTLTGGAVAWKAYRV